MGQSPGAAGPLGTNAVPSPLGSRKTLSILIRVYKMENNYETLRMPELKALARERRLRGYSRLRKAELIAFLQDEDRRQEEPSTREPELEVAQPLAVALTKKQLKRRRNRNSKLNKKFKNLSKEIDNLKSQIEGLENKIAKAAQSTNAGSKGKKIRSMKRDVVKAIEKLKESEKSFKSIESRIPKNNNCNEIPLSELRIR